MTALLIALFGMVAMAGILEIFDQGGNTDSSSDSDDNAIDPPEETGTVYQVDIQLRNSLINLDTFDPKVDVVVLTTRSLDLDFSMNDEGDTLSISYGDTLTQLSASWGSGGIANSVIIRHIDGSRDSEETSDYRLQLSHENNNGSDPVFLEIDAGVEQYFLGDFHGIVNLAESDHSLTLVGQLENEPGALMTRDELLHLRHEFDWSVQGSIGGDNVQFMSLQGSIALGAGDDYFELRSGQALVDLGVGDDTVASQHLGSEGDIIIAYGGSGSDNMSGSTGLDYLDGGRDSDRVSGGQGDDIIAGGTSGDELYGGDGNDTLYGAQDPNQRTLQSQLSFFDIDDGAADTIFGGSGNDEIVLGQFDTAFGGLGENEFTVAYDPSIDGMARVQDFHGAVDSLNIVVKLDERLLDLWSGEQIEGRLFDVTTDVMWSCIDPTVSKFVLIVGGFSVAEIVSDSLPKIGLVKVTGYLDI
jgi:hypothetical protein